MHKCICITINLVIINTSIALRVEFAVLIWKLGDRDINTRNITVNIYERYNLPNILINCRSVIVIREVQI